MTSRAPTLFKLPTATIAAAPIQAEWQQLAAALPESIRLGAMTWTYPAWKGLVYAEEHTEKQLAALGLTAYAKHPLLRAVELDRAYYRPPTSAELRALAEQVPSDFGFVVKAHEECVINTFPRHARYGKRAGEKNPRFLDAQYAANEVVAPLIEGLGSQVAALLFQFPPQQFDGHPSEFAHALEAFLAQLPVAPFPYAVELRNAELLTADYGSALKAVSALHCHNVWPRMPSILLQARRLPKETRRLLLVRWLMPASDTFESASARFAPFGKLQRPDPGSLAEVVDLVRRAQSHGVSSVVMLDNKAEGCAPETAVRVARELVRVLAG